MSSTRNNNNKRTVSAISPAPNGNGKAVPSSVAAPAVAAGADDDASQLTGEDSAIEVDASTMTEAQKKKARITHFVGKKATIKDFKEGTHFVDTQGNKILLKECSSQALRGFITNNDIRDDDYIKIRNGKVGPMKQAIVATYNRVQSIGEKDGLKPWETDDDANSKSKASGKAAPMNRLRLANVVMGERMKEAAAKRGESLSKDDLTVGTAESKAGDREFWQVMTDEYNSKNDEYDQMQVDDIEVEEKYLPSNFITVKDIKTTKRVFMQCMNELESSRQLKSLSGRNNSDDVEEIDAQGDKLVLDPSKNKQYVLYWHALAGNDPDRYKTLKADFPEGIFGDVGSEAAKKRATSTGKKKEEKDDKLAKVLEESVDLERQMLEEQKKTNRTMSTVATSEQKVKLRQQKGEISAKRKKLAKETQAAMTSLAGETRKEKNAAFEARVVAVKQEEPGASQDSQASNLEAIVEYDEEIAEINKEMDQLDSLNGDSNNNNNNNNTQTN